MASKETVRRQNQRTKIILEAYKMSKGCMDCGYHIHPEALDFDHRPGTTKIMAVGTMKQKRVAWYKIFEEMEKCDVVCANCHRIRTAKRRG